MNSIDPFNFHLENVTVDCYQLMSGFTSYNACNYPEANIFEYQNIKNITLFESNKRTLPILDSMINYSGAGNFTLDTAILQTYGTNNQNYSPVWIGLYPKWIPQDSVQRIVSFSNASISLPDNSQLNKLSSIYFNLFVNGYTRPIYVIYSDNYHYDISYTYYPIVILFVSPLAEILISNNTFINCSWRNINIAITYPGKVTINDIFFKDLLPVANQIIYVLQYITLNISNLSWSNNQPINMPSLVFFYFNGVNNSTLTMDRINISDTLINRNLFMEDFSK